MPLLRQARVPSRGPPQAGKRAGAMTYEKKSIELNKYEMAQ